MNRLIYVILETERDEQGYIPCIVKEGETGFYKTDWHWGADFQTAIDCAIHMNERMGIDASTAREILNENLRQSFALLKH